ncbi:MAG: biotin--[acetyl-CoA-carboxylase] ligase [Phycisphaerales bacterium]|nr:biotin--[acetyl-CoA-carboxylase] ligase [Phycisphaerales bacterium]MCB9856345.1 biotin--[acetyl-CoA-carboxylase] ligase [Phycisphaerales bacterium]MCB9864017.1 biotin--[acetyl-CoA-carboxylase] ligase [Phycisphaerales bacterium]
MQLFQFQTLDSTNETAKRMIASGEIASDACVVAREQTAGRGTKGRTWISPRDAGLYLSVVLFDVKTTQQAMQKLTLACGIACAQTLRRRFDIEVRVKPVNDLMLEGGKLGGILTEANIENGAIKSLIVGVGINLKRSDLGDVAPPHGPAFIEEALASPEPIDVESLAAALADAIASIIRSIGEKAEAPSTDEWRSLMTE